MIIAFKGKMGTGKTTSLEYVREVLERKGKPTKLIKFAGILYELQDLIYEKCGLELQGDKDRKLLQWLGTDWGRSIDDNIWVNVWEHKANKALSEGYIVLCDDVRFLNEAELLTKKYKDNKILIGLEGESKGEYITNLSHKSELDINLIEPDYTIINNRSIDELKDQLYYVLESKLNLLESNLNLKELPCSQKY